MAGRRASRTRRPYGRRAVDETYADGGGGIAALAASSSNACVSCLGFIRTRTVSGFGLIRFQPAFVTIPPLMARTRYIAPVNRTIATGLRIPARSELRFRPALGSTALSPERVCIGTASTWANARPSLPLPSRAIRLVWYGPGLA